MRLVTHQSDCLPPAFRAAALGLLGFLLMFAGVVNTWAAEARLRLELNGTWEFRMDPDDAGVARRWFTGKVAYPDRIKVPGCWQAQGFGPPQGHLRHDYQGKAWYRRRVSVPPDWAGKRIWVHIGAASNTALVYVNGSKVGGVEEFLTPYELDATDTIRPGSENVIACCVDSTGPAPRGMFNLMGRWGGLTREVFLEARLDPAIDDVFVIPDVKNKTARIQVVLRRQIASGAWRGEVLVRITPVVGGEACGGRSTMRFAAGQQQCGPRAIDVKLDNMHSWSPEDPFLYCIEASLLADGNLLDVVRDRFGMRQFEVGKGGVLLLNGRPYFVRGLGDDSVEVITGIQYPDKQIYVDRLRMIKRFGFNGIRFLSHTPIKEYFEAADEVGVLLLCDGEYYGGPKQSIPILKKQVARLVKAHGNHPSWYAFSSGNELFHCQGPNPDPDWMEYIRYAHDTFKRVDPTRFFIGSEGADVFPTDIITQRARFDGPPSPPQAAEQPFYGLIDEVAYFKRALSEREIRTTADCSNAATYPETIRLLGPSGYWRLDEETPGKAADSSGHGHHGVYDQTMKTEDLKQPGVLKLRKAGGAMRVSAARKGVHLQHVAKNVFTAGNDPLSISLWVKPMGFQGGDFGTPFAFGAADVGAALLIAEDGTTGTGKLRLGRFYDDFHVSDGALQPGHWNHIGITYDGSLLKLYLNGKLDSSVKVRFAMLPVDGRIGGSIVKRSPPTVDPTAAGQLTLREKYASRPHIWHEFPNTYVGPLPDLTIMDRWTGVFQDDHAISYDRKQVAKLGLLERYCVLRRRSIDLFYLYLKDHYERARHSPTMDGYNYWCFTDFPPGPEGDMTTYGMFSTVYEPEKFPDAEPILQFNRETVLLIDAGAEQRVREDDQPTNVTLSISHYGRKPIRGGRLFWTIKAGDRVLQHGKLEPVDAAVGHLKQLGTITLGPYRLASARRVRLVVRLESEACRQRNHWDFWVFPAKKPGLWTERHAPREVQETTFYSKPTGLSVSEATRVRGIANLTGAEALDKRYRTDPNTPAEQSRLVLTNRLTAGTVDYLVGGGTVLLLTEDGALARPRELGFWPPWIRSTATLIEDHPAVAGFPHDGFCAYQFYRLFGGGLKVIQLTEKGSLEREKLRPIVWSLTQDSDPKGPGSWANLGNRWKIYRDGILCEGRIGDGKLLVCCLRILEGIRAGRLEAGYLLDCLVQYALSERFAPSSTPMTVQEARQVFQVGQANAP